MSIRNLEHIFHPKSIAVVGASIKLNTVGSVIVKNLLSAGFSGPIFPVNPKYQSVFELRCYPDIGNLPVSPDLAIICTPPHTVPGLIAELGKMGTKGAIVITAGFHELGTAEGRDLEQSMLESARPHLLRIVGPNCLGIISTGARLNGSFAPTNAKKGGIAFVAQSGALMTSVLDWATSRNIGFSHLVSLGDMADVDFGDILDYLAADAQTSAILLYIEAVTHTRKFMSAARAASRLKPVIAIKAGRHTAAAKAAATHTGALAGKDAVYDAALRRAGILRVADLGELFNALETLAVPQPAIGKDLVILTNGGGIGVLATDALVDAGGELTKLSVQTVQRLDAVLPGTWSRCNPVDIIGDAPGSRYAAAMNILLEAPEVRAVLAINCPTAIASSGDAARAVIDAAKARDRCVMTNWLGAGAAVEARTLFAEASIATYDTPTEAVRGFMHLSRYRQGQETILEVPESSSVEFSADLPRARKVIDAAVRSGGGWLEPNAVQTILECFGISMPYSAIAKSADAAASLAALRNGSVCLKAVSPDIVHKSDVGAVVLDLTGADMVRSAAEAMSERIRRAMPTARLEGYLVQDMVRQPDAQEVIVGMTLDRDFGPVLLFGHGGIATEVIADTALALPPLNRALALGLMRETRVFRQLQGYRDRKPAAINALADVLTRLSQLVCDIDEILEIDINPLKIDSTNVIAIDARIRVGITDSAPHGTRLAIKPYPKELERIETIFGIGDVLLRPIRPNDAQALENFLNRMSPEDIRHRFFTPLREFGSRQLARLTQIDYDREMAFVLERRSMGGTPEVLAVARLAADPNNEIAEFALTVRSDLQRRGIGRLMLRHLITYAHERGISELFGDVLRNNGAMISLGRALGFSVSAFSEPDVALRLSLRL